MRWNGGRVISPMAAIATSTSTSTSILPRAEASRASDVINMVKTSFKREHAHYMRTCGYFGIDTFDPQVGHILCFD